MELLTNERGQLCKASRVTRTPRNTSLSLQYGDHVVKVSRITARFRLLQISV
ncbi:hypothetical protein DPMN_166371 [Dreissena polymorpha]|uniref:Uncharacterized protein n=1 Tax=Dreissena polymorpha TaxID=45954 RepID=A0A9D4EYQ5_DREPO|nr:hypothetical protein DPMN_166371 [Dreissena polymorpha]